MQKTRIPEEIIFAAEALFSSYDVDIRNLLAQGTEKDDDDKKAKYLTICDAGKMFSVSRFTLYRLIKAGKIRAAKLSNAKSGKVLIELTSCEEYFHRKLINNQVG